jgi:hypothetical protein
MAPKDGGTAELALRAVGNGVAHRQPDQALPVVHIMVGGRGGTMATVGVAAGTWGTSLRVLFLKARRLGPWSIPHAASPPDRDGLGLSLGRFA